MSQKWPKTHCGKFRNHLLRPKSKNNCTLFSSIFQNFAPFPRYGRLKSKFLCEPISQCVYSFSSIELTKTRNTWSLTAVIKQIWTSCKCYRARVQDTGYSGRVNFFITGSESKFHEGLPMDSLRLAIPRKVLNKIFNAIAQNFISQDSRSEKYFCYSYNFNS